MFDRGQESLKQRAVATTPARRRRRSARRRSEVRAMGNEPRPQGAVGWVLLEEVVLRLETGDVVNHAATVNHAVAVGAEDGKVLTSIEHHLLPL